MDAAQDRLVAESRGRFSELVEAARAGYIFAHDAKQYSRWRADSDRKSGRKPGRDLAQLARDFGGQVEHGGFEFRN